MRLDTRGPAETLAEVLGFFQAVVATQGPLQALGIGTFGPIELDPASPRWGCLGATPKPGWGGYPLATTLQDALGCPVGLDTDVNAAGLAEGLWGAGRGQDLFVYVTVGTGIGGGVLVAQTPLRGLSHPELGHIPVRRHPLDTEFSGSCPFHGDCLEGLASGSALQARGVGRLDDLPADHPLWEILGDYLGQLAANLFLTVSPQRLIIGGGVGQHPALLTRARTRTAHWLGGYLRPETLPFELESRLVPPELGDRAGVLGALAIAARRQPAPACG